MDWFEQIVAFVAAYRHLAYLLIFAFAFLESIPVIGLLIPGSTLIVAAAILVPTGALELGPALVVAALGSMAGDTASFLMGRHYGHGLLQWGPLARREALVERAEKFFRTNGGKAVLIGRLTPPLRGLLPAIAGMAGMGGGRFTLIATIAALCWSAAHVLPGALVGASLQLAGEVTARLGLLILLILAGGYLLMLIARAALYWGLPAAARGLRALLVWGRAHNNFLGREIVAMLDPAHPEARALAPLALLLIFGGWAFFVIIEQVLAGDALVRADASIFNALQALRTPWGDMAMVAITELGDAKVTVPVFLAGVAWLLWRNALKDAVYLAAAVVIAQAVAAAVKVALHTPRPIPELYEGWSAFSFPSGHATVNAVLYGFLAVMVMRQAGPVLRGSIASIAVSLVGLIALSRLYLGAHWFTDVAGGLGFGLAWVGLLGIAYVRHRPAGGLSRGLLPTVAAVLVTAGAINIASSHDTDMARYRPAPRLVTMNAAEWLEGGWLRMPSHRIDLGGEREEPFVLQLAGSPTALSNILQGSGWREPAAWDAFGAVSWLATGKGMGSLPVLPKLHRGLTPVLMLIRQEEGLASRLVLRLWDSGFRLEGRDGEAILWLATVTREDMSQPMGLFSITVTDANANEPRDMLARAMPALPRKRPDAPAGDADWDGSLLLSAVR